MIGTFNKPNLILQWSISLICLHVAFTLVDPKSVNIKSRHRCLFPLSGSARSKAAHRMLMKLIPEAELQLLIHSYPV